MSDSEIIVELEGVSKRFGSNRVLRNVDLTVPRGRIIGLLGGNGIGKSTLLRHIIGLYLADCGSVKTFGVDAAKLSAKELGRIGYVHQEGELIDWMTVGQLLDYVKTYYPGWDNELENRFINDYDISLKKRVGSLSPGQRQIISILLATAFGPELIILDEPASALDPIARGKFLDFLLELIQDGQRTIIVSSHILSDVEKIIDHVLIMGKGKILCDCSFDQIREQYCQVMVTGNGDNVPGVMPFDEIVSCEREGQRVSIVVKDTPVEIIESKLADINCTAQTRSLTLDEIYKTIISYQ